jgi:hypothetical protein
MSLANMPTLEVLFAPSVVGANTGDRLVLDVTDPGLDTGTLGDGAFFYDISTSVRSISTNRGRRRALERFGTGTATITLDNRDRSFDPTNTASPYYNATVGVTGVVPSIPVVIRATWDGTTYSIFRGFIDSWTFDYSDAGIGDATATMSCSDAFKPLSTIIGGLPSSASISSSGTTTFDIGISEPSDGGGFGVSSIDVTGTGTTGGIKVSGGVTTTPIIGAGTDLPGLRIRAILDAIAWPDNLRDIDEGTTFLAPQDATKTPIEMLQEAAAADSGVIYVDDDGTLVFADRDAIISDDRSINVQSVYDTTDAEGKKFVGTSIVYDDSLIYNIVKIDRTVTNAVTGRTLTGTTVIVSNAESISLYGARTLAIEVPIVSTVGSDTSYGQNEAKDLALFLASQYANPELRPEEIRFAPQGDPSTLYPDLLSRKIRDRVTVKFAVPGGGDAVERDCFVESVGHTITPGNWSTTFGLSSATFYTGFFILDNTNFGVLDQNKLAH